MSDILTPQYPVADDILYHHQAEVTTPVGRIHLDTHVLHRGYFLDIPHTEQVTAYSPDRHPVSQRELLLRLLTLDIVRYYLAFVPAVAASETTAAFITFIPLTMASEAIVDHFQRTTIYALFLTYYL